MYVFFCASSCSLQLKTIFYTLNIGRSFYRALKECVFSTLGCWKSTSNIPHIEFFSNELLNVSSVGSSHETSFRKFDKHTPRNSSDGVKTLYAVRIPFGNEGKPMAPFGHNPPPHAVVVLSYSIPINLD